MGNKLISALYFKTVMTAKAVRKGAGEECLAPASLDSSRFCPLPPPPSPPQRWLWVPLPTRQCPLGTAQARYDAPSFDLLCSTSDFSLLAICCSGVDGIVPFCQHLLPPLGSSLALASANVSGVARINVLWAVWFFFVLWVVSG